MWRDPSSRVDTIADRRREHYLSAVGIEYGEMMTAAADEKPAVLFIKREACGRRTRRERPAIPHHECVDIDA